MFPRSFSRAAGVGHALLLAAATASLAQTVTGSVTGTVTDSSGAVIPNAQVTAVNTSTGVRTPATTDGAGAYTIRFLPIGPYTLEVAAQGFAKATVPPFTLEVNQTAKLDAKLQVGASTNVEVQAQLAPILDASDATLGLSLDANQISTIPLNGRNFSSLTLFQPGAVATDPTGLNGSNATVRDTYNSGVVTQNGNRAQDNTYLLDGISIDETQNNLIGYNPSPDALQEVRVISANPGAQYGNVGGGDVVSVLKSGTNKLHGSAYEYLENQNLTANTWANKFAGITTINPFTQSLFGGTLGGPIKKNKLFFFVDYTGTRYHQGGQGNASVLSAAERGGDFSAAEAAGYQLVDPFNGYQPFPNNRIPITNPVAQYLIAHPQYYPLPNHPATDGLDQNNYLAPQNMFNTNDQGDVKIEYDWRQQDKFTAFYSQGLATNLSTAALAVTFPNTNTYPDKLGGGTWVHTFSPAIVNELRFGFTRIRWDNSIPTDTTGAFGLNGDQVVGLPTPAPQQFVGFSYQGVGNNQLTGVGDPAIPQQIRDNTYSVFDDLTIQRGKHLFTIGGLLLRYQQNFTQYGGGGQLGSYNFAGQYSTLPNASLTYGPADFLLDRSQSQAISLANGFFGQRQTRVAGYVQDDWKITDKLTLNLGVRYEYYSPWTEVNNQIANVILGGPQQGLVEYAKRVPAGAPAGSFICPTAACFNAYYPGFQPRIGFAYQANPRLVFRGGYGQSNFFEGSSLLSANAPFITAFMLNGVAPSSPTNPGNFFAAANGFQVGAAGGASNVGYSAFNQNYRPAIVQEFNFNTEVQLNNSTSVQFGYTGELAQRLIDYRNGNQLTAAQAQAIAALPSGAALPAALQSPLANLVGQGGTIETADTEGVATYNSLQITARRRLSRGFEGTINYTWAKSLTDTNGNYGASGSSGPNAIQDGYNIPGDYGPSELDVRHNLSANGSYLLPFGRGQAFGKNANRFEDLLAGGWTLSSTAIAYSGLPVTITSNPNSNTNAYNSGAQRANQFRKLNVVNRSVQNWFGTDPSATPCGTATGGLDDGICAYGPELANTFGTARVGTERAPGFEQVDSSLFKDFHLTESQTLGFRADAFNVMNLTSYSNPNSSVNSSNFGQITAAKNSPRTIEFSAHYSF